MHFVNNIEISTSKNLRQTYMLLNKNERGIKCEEKTKINPRPYEGFRAGVRDERVTHSMPSFLFSFFKPFSSRLFSGNMVSKSDVRFLATSM